MAWMETDYSKHTHALSMEDKMAAKTEHLGALRIMGKTAPKVEVIRKMILWHLTLLSHKSEPEYFK